jgi:hypothetical protein
LLFYINLIIIFQSTITESYPIIDISFRLCLDETIALKLPLTVDKPVLLPSAEEEIALGPPSWLWDYLRRSKMVDYG